MPTKIQLPKLPPADKIREEMNSLKLRMVELRSLLRLAETHELARKVHTPRHPESGAVR